MNPPPVLTTLWAKFNYVVFGVLPPPPAEQDEKDARVPRPRLEQPAAEKGTEPAPPAPASAPAPTAEAPPAKAPRFDGYPYLITPLSPGVFNLMLMPETWSDEMLIELARGQATANQLKACLALGPDRTVYANVDGALRFWPLLPASFIVESGALLAPVEFEQTAHFIDRAERLEHFVRSLQSRSGSGYGNETRGGAPSSPADALLQGRVNDDGSPAGLHACPRCGEHRGQCLDTVPQEMLHTLTVHCRCENINRCARCGDLLFERRLDANYYSRATGLVLFVPGGYARRHECAATGLRRAG